MKVTIGLYPKKGKRIERVKINRHDTYSLCDTLALVIYPALKKFREIGIIGCPGSLAEGKTVEEGCKEWGEMIDKMIFSFQEIANNNKNQPPLTRTEEQKNNYLAYHKKIQEGLNLFAKYYQNLWW